MFNPNFVAFIVSEVTAFIMNAETSQTIRARILGLSMQILQMVSARRMFVASECYAHNAKSFLAPTF